MAHPLETLIDQMMAKAAREGAFDNLPGTGEPLKDLNAPKDAVFHRMMKEAGATPEALSLYKTLKAERQVLADLPDGPMKDAQMKKVADLETRYGIAYEALKKHG